MSFQCVHPCKSIFSARAGLSHHQNDCPSYRTSQALKQAQRRARQLIVSKPKASNSHSKPIGKSLDRRKVRIDELGAHVSLQLPISKFAALLQHYAHLKLAPSIQQYQ